MTERPKRKKSERKKLTVAAKNFLINFKSALKYACGAAKQNKKKIIAVMAGYFLAALILSFVVFEISSYHVASSYEVSPFGTQSLMLHGENFSDIDMLKKAFDESGASKSAEVVPFQKITDAEMYGDLKNSFSHTAIATDERFFDKASVKIKSGKAISLGDVDNRRKNAVISEDLATKLYPESDPIGREIRINNIVYTVVGIYEGKNGYDAGYTVVVPFTSARMLYGASNVSTYVVLGTDGDEKSLDLLKGAIDKALSDNKKISSDLETSYRLESTMTQSDSAYMICFLLYIIMLLLCSIGLYIFLLSMDISKDKFMNILALSDGVVICGTLLGIILSTLAWIIIKGVSLITLNAWLVSLGMILASLIMGFILALLVRQTH